MESNHVAVEPANAVRDPVLDVVNDLGPARRPEVSDMFRTRCCNTTPGWIVMVALFSAGHLLAGAAVTEAQAQAPLGDNREPTGGSGSMNQISCYL